MAENEGMTPTETTDTARSGAETIAPTASDSAAAPKAAAEGADISVGELREWLRRWVADATGQPIDNITVDRPMEEFGLASRDALALGGDIEEFTGVVLNATIVYQHPTIASLAERIVNGEPDVPVESSDDSFYTAGYQPGA